MNDDNKGPKEDELEEKKSYNKNLWRGTFLGPCCLAEKQ